MNINMTIIGQLISFAIFVFICMKYIWPPLVYALAERKQKIAEGLNAAELAKKELQKANSLADEIKKISKEKADGIIKKAKKSASDIIEQAKIIAQDESKIIQAHARLEVEQELNLAKEALRTQVNILAITAAEKILSSSIDATKHNKMITQVAAEL